MSTSPAPRFTVEAVDLFERDVVLRMPFRFGVVTLTRAPQAFARVRIRLADGRSGEGMAAELLAPKWFDKNPALGNEDNFEQLRAALGIARTLYLDGSADTGFGRFIRHYPAQIERAAARGLNSLVALYGPALLDRAALDALGRALDEPFHALVAQNRVGLVATGLCPDLAGFDFDAFLARMKPAASIAARHTVGLVDPITRSDQAERVGDGLPETLEEVVATYGQRWFKLKVAGDVAADVERLARIAGVLDRMEGAYACSLDGNEQYDDIEGVLQLWRRMHDDPRLARLCASVAFVEQPIKRQTALDRDVSALSAETPVIIDESDDALDAFVRAKAMGYRGVSSKTCKGIYKSLINAARCEAWNREEPGRYLMSAEDLTIQAGLGLQQDLALVSLLGIRHVERNGHHYVNGMAAYSPAEQQRFLDAHPDLYERSFGAVRVRIQEGELAIGSLGGPGFASGAAPDWASMRTMNTP
ncbi:MAG: mandelate racemase [Burkholderiales bacterium]|nr:mandelate racemase [Burkholderiales bacterium]